ncbi:SusC/RagA family TonB-linked outer membrane protein [Myroides odoratus]
MKTQILTTCGYRIAMLVSLLISYPTYAVSNDNHLFFNASYFLQDKQQKGIIKLSGTVKDAQGVLGGVIVSVGNKTVATDLDGKYTIDVSIGDRITFSMLGYKERSMVYSSSLGAVLNIELLEDTTTLDEIVVNAGYYTVKDRERTGSIARVTAKDIEFQPVLNPIQAIQGRMAGVSITQNTGVAGGGFDIQIRGRNSLRRDGNTPLYIIDGVPFTEDSSRLLAGGILPLGESNPLNSINPNDIESIEILKDADATAIYGSRGANGVVLVTTKTGKSGKTKLTINSSTAFSSVAKFLNLLDTTQYLSIREQAFKNDNITTYPDNAYDLNGTWNKNRYTNWQKELIGRTAKAQTLQASLSGGNKHTQFMLSGNHNEETTVFPGDFAYKRNTLSFFVNHKNQDEKLRLKFSVNYNTQKNNLMTLDLTSTSRNLAPNAPNLFQEDGSLNWQDNTFENPLAQLNSLYQSSSKGLSSNLNLEYAFDDLLSFKINTGYSDSRVQQYNIALHTRFNPSYGYGPEKTSVQYATSHSNSWIIEPQLNGVLKIGRHQFNYILGSTFQENTFTSLGLYALGFTSNSFVHNLKSASTVDVSSQINSTYRYSAIYARLNYNFSDKYYLNLTARRDGSSRFGENYKFGNFGAIGFAWILSEEPWLNNLSWLSLLKLRSSYGVTGSDNIGDYAYLDTYTLSRAKYDSVVGLYPSRLYNPNFSWEKTKKLEIALEFNLFDNRLNSTIAWYNNRSSNQLVGTPLPGTTGFSSIQSNLNAVVENKGVEVTFNTQNIKQKKWSWTTDFNLTIPKNKLVSFPNLEGSTYSNQYIIGQPINIIKLYQYTGIDPKTGIFTFKDFNNDGNLSAIDDKKIIESFFPKFFWGLTNTINYKNLSVSFLFQFVKQRNYNHLYFFNRPGALNNTAVDYYNNSWDQYTPVADYQILTTNNPDVIKAYSDYKTSDQVVSDASYIRLKNFNISYTLPAQSLNGIHAMVYFQAQNIWTLTRYKGYDPEFTTTGFLPPLRTFAFGINLNF